MTYHSKKAVIAAVIILGLVAVTLFVSGIVWWINSPYDFFMFSMVVGSLIGAVVLFFLIIWAVSVVKDEWF